MLSAVINSIFFLTPCNQTTGLSIISIKSNNKGFTRLLLVLIPNKTMKLKVLVYSLSGANQDIFSKAHRTGYLTASYRRLWQL